MPANRSAPIGLPGGSRGWAVTVLAATIVLLAVEPAAAQRGGQLVLSVIDRDSGEPIACRMHLRNAAGRPLRPAGAPFWEDHFVLDGEVTLELPRGEYTFEMERGLEYLVRRGHFIIEDGAEDAREADMQRFFDMAAEGWFAGDLALSRPWSEVEQLMRAEELYVASLITWDDGEDRLQGRPPPEPLLEFDGRRFAHLRAGRQRWAGGEIHYYGLPQPLPLAAPASDPRQTEYPFPLAAIIEARAAGAWVELTRPYWWDLPLLVAAGQVDSIQVAHGDLVRGAAAADEGHGKSRDRLFYPGVAGNPRWSQDIYFRLLDCGLRIPPTAGSGSGAGPNPAGYNRVYVQLDGPLTHEGWWEGLRAGRVVITNGPLLVPSIEGYPPGHVFRAAAGEALDFEIDLTVSTRDPITYLEIVKDGRVAHSLRFEEYAEAGRLPPVSFDRSGWFLIRVVADLPDAYRFAMTGPFYVEIGERRRISREAAQFFLDWVHERAGRIEIADPAQRTEVLAAHRAARDFWQRLLDGANAP